MNASAEPLIAVSAQARYQANDVHSKLNPSTLAERIDASSVEEVAAAIQLARVRRLPLASCGGRHAMGGQQFASQGVLVDTSGMERILGFDHDSGIIEVEAGIQWPALMRGYLDLQAGQTEQWGIRQKQTGADRLSIGGALSSNIHGRVLDNKPIIEDVVSFKLIDANGDLVECSREQNVELFTLVIGGYGLFGVIVSVKLQLVPRRKMQRIVNVCTLDELPGAFSGRIDDGYVYGDFQFVTDERRVDFLRRGVFSCYRTVDLHTPIPDDQIYMSEQNWQELLYYAHVDKGKAFDRFTDFYRSTSGQFYWSDTHQFSLYLDDYHAKLDQHLCSANPGTEMITELYVPRDQLTEFIHSAREVLRKTKADLIYGTVRLIKKDDESFLAWAREDFACVIFNLHVEHTAVGIANSAVSFRALIDVALGLGGSYFLTYHRYADREQVVAAYPQFPSFLAKKHDYDPTGIFASDWYCHHAALFGEAS
jgi:FAD/FMN-containing dehydrogenase